MVVVGGYLLLSLAIPGIALGGSILLAAAGVVLLWLHFTHRGGAWALYAGAVLTAVGTLRVIGDLLPFTVQGETALGWASPCWPSRTCAIRRPAATAGRGSSAASRSRGADCSSCWACSPARPARSTSSCPR